MQDPPRRHPLGGVIHGKGSERQGGEIYAPFHSSRDRLGAAWVLPIFLGKWILCQGGQAEPSRGRWLKRGMIRNLGLWPWL